MMFGKDSEHQWAYGCVKCTHGVKDGHYKPPTGCVELLLERLVYAEQIGPDYFCDCRAGQALRKHLRRTLEQYEERHAMISGQHVAIGRIILEQARQTVRLWQGAQQPRPEGSRQVQPTQEAA